MGIAYNANYLTWFEVGRTELMRCLGMSYLSVEQRGFNLPLVGAELKLRAPIRYDDLVVLEAWIGRLRSRAVTFEYAIYLEGNTLASGQTTHACVRAEDDETVTLPPWLLAL